MLLLLVILALWAGSTFLFYYLIDVSNWFLFLFVPAGLVSSLLILALILYLYILLIGQHTKNEGFLKHCLLRSACWLLFKVMHIKFTVYGRENIPNQTFVVYANHKSYFDPFYIYYGIHKKPITAVGKKSLFKIHLMKIISKTFKAVELDRENDREAAKTMVNAIKMVKNGMNMIIFPEGGIKTRDVEEMVNLRAGAYKLALKPQAAIVPVAIIGSSKTAKVAFFKKKIIKAFILPPILPEVYQGMNTTEIGTKVEEMINQKVKEYEQ